MQKRPRNPISLRQCEAETWTSGLKGQKLICVVGSRLGGDERWLKRQLLSPERLRGISVETCFSVHQLCVMLDKLTCQTSA